MAEQKTSISIKLISILFILIGIYCLINLIFVVLSINILKEQMSILSLILGGLLQAGLTFLSFFLAINLWKRKNWARKISIYFVIICALLGIYGVIYMNSLAISLTGSSSSGFMIGGISVVVLLTLLILYFLILSKKVKETFG